eukprot:CAMPEP_0180467574 /NCGR_PEP_ID=MMETSP1036_2-20121128/27071_1 /TAXON_ID=632150 /ORGANISM="Azadinium spinosum, Strain 3D9" /LENGTH=461 /DNA_ID=CAMNT_0022474543 /DNA_START=34 /DNA_END=1419 /DNA_ORIENTATION=+
MDHFPAGWARLQASAATCMPCLSAEMLRRVFGWKISPPANAETQVITLFQRRLQYPLACQTAKPQASLAMEHVIWRLVRSFMGVPPILRVVTFGHDAMGTDPWSTLVRIWYVGMGRACHILEGHTDVILAAALHGDMVITGSYDRTARVWAASDGSLRCVLQSDSAVCAVAADDGFIVTGCLDGAASVWHVAGPSSVAAWRMCADRGGCSILAWPQQPVHRLEGHTGAVVAVVVHRFVVVTGSTDATVRVWAAASGLLLQVLRGHISRVVAVAAHSDVILTGSVDGTGRLWDAASGACRHILAGGRTHKAVGEDGCDASKGGGVKAGAQGVGTTRPAPIPSSYSCWRALQQLQRWRRGGRVPVVAVAVRGGIAATGSARGVVQVWDSCTGALLHILQPSPRDLGSWAELVISTDATMVVACWKSGEVTMWGTKRGELQHLVMGGFATPICSARNQAVAFAM